MYVFELVFLSFDFSLQFASCHVRGILLVLGINKILRSRIQFFV